jgi:hypothetical protein
VAALAGNRQRRSALAARDIYSGPSAADEALDNVYMTFLRSNEERRETGVVAGVGEST